MSLRNKQVLYSDHVDTIIALVQHLAVTEYASRTPSMLIEHLSLDREEVLYVLENFNGLFRRSVSLDEHTQEYGYTLQLRYEWYHTRQDALQPEYLSSLLTFISNMVGEEQSRNRQSSANWAIFIAALVAAIAATAAALISLAKP
jgi:hypothetical protein